MQKQNKPSLKFSDIIEILLNKENEKRFKILANKGVELICKLRNFIEIFCEPSMLPVQDLLNETISKKSFRINAHAEIQLYDRKTSFQEFKDECLGIIVPTFITTPLQIKINKQDLDNCRFSSNKIHHWAIISEFEDNAFEGFSFKNTYFEDFTFVNSYFINCDFSHAKFSGSIKFENVYMDQATANSFTQALLASSKLSGMNLIVEGQKQLFLISSDATQPILKLDPSVKIVIPEEADLSDYHSLEELDEEAEEKLPDVVITEEAPDENVPNTTGEGSSYSFYDSACSLANNVYNWFSPTAIDPAKAEAVKEENKKELNDSIQREKELKKLQRELNRQFENMEKEFIKQSIKMKKLLKL